MRHEGLTRKQWVRYGNRASEMLWLIPTGLITISAITGIPKTATLGCILLALVVIIRKTLFTKGDFKDALALGGLAIVAAIWSIGNAPFAKTLKVIEMYSSTLFIPLLFLKSYFDRDQIKKILWIYCLLTACIYGLSLITAIYRYKFEIHPHYQSEFFFYTELASGAVGAKPIYLSLAGSFASIIFLFLTKNTIHRIVYLAFMTAILLLLNARTVLIAHCFLLLGVSLYALLARKNYKLIGLFLGMTLLIFIGWRTVNQIHAKPNRSFLINLKESIERSKHPVAEDNGLTIRVGIWTQAAKLILNNVWFGVGTGQELPALLMAYQQSGQTYLIEERFNCHNQYLSLLLSFGIVGFGLVLYGYSKVLARIVSHRSQVSIIYGCIFGVLIIAMLTESVLNRFHGLTLVAYMNTMFFVLTKKSETPEHVE